ncbi:MAG TPA: hypothetical protein VIC28_14310 [Thermoanaerobaculia bacterium]
MSPFNRLGAPLRLALVGLAMAFPAAARQENAPLRLLAPRPGATLLAGSTAELEWEAELPARVTEWEAFLSFDGGKTYPVRITPHLDRDLRRVRWQVPVAPTSEARLLLRFGDERRETYHELPHRFAIAASPGTAWPLTLASLAAAPGEPALPGGPGVVAWVEGTRRGGSLRQRVAPERRSGRGSLSAPETPAAVAVLATHGTRIQTPVLVRRSAGGRELPARGTSLNELAPLLLAADILLLTQRQNE